MASTEASKGTRKLRLQAEVKAREAIHRRMHQGGVPH